jgi:toxin ParE1/3/4
MVRINWTLLAVDDLKSIGLYISRDSKRYAKIEVQKIIVSTKILKTQPFLGKIVNEVNENNIRELIEGNYRIIYEIISDNQIDILTVHHSSRELNQRKFI